MNFKNEVQNAIKEHCMSLRAHNAEFTHDDVLGIFRYTEYVTVILHRYDVGQMMLRLVKGSSAVVDDLYVYVDFDMRVFECHLIGDHEEFTIEYDHDDFLCCTYSRYKLLP